MKKYLIPAFVLLLVLKAAPFGYAACVVNVSTGYDQTAGAVLTPGDPDDDYVVTSPGGETAALTGSSDRGFPIPPWLANSDQSLWISPAADSNAAPGLYTYKIEFEIPDGVDASKLALVGRWANDDLGKNIIINGTETGFEGGGFGAWQDFPENFGLGLFQVGTNTIEFIVENGGTADNPAGLRVEACVASPPEVPEERPYNIYDRA